MNSSKESVQRECNHKNYTSNATQQSTYFKIMTSDKNTHVTNAKPQVVTLQSPMKSESIHKQR